MNLTDEDLQNSIEQGKDSNSLEAKAYRKVFSALKKEPYVLPVRFADQVLQRIETNESLAKDYFWFGVGIVAFIVAAIVTILKVNFKPDFGVLKFLNGYLGLLVFGAAFLLLIHFIDKRLLGNQELGSRN